MPTEGDLLAALGDGIARWRGSVGDIEFDIDVDVDVDGDEGLNKDPVGVLTLDNAKSSLIPLEELRRSDKLDLGFNIDPELETDKLNVGDISECFWCDVNVDFWEFSDEDLAAAVDLVV